jgi:hypothetical protein
VALALPVYGFSRSLTPQCTYRLHVFYVGAFLLTHAYSSVVLQLASLLPHLLQLGVYCSFFYGKK